MRYIISGLSISFSVFIIFLIFWSSLTTNFALFLDFFSVLLLLLWWEYRYSCSMHPTSSTQHFIMMGMYLAARTTSSNISSFSFLCKIITLHTKLRAPHHIYYFVGGSSSPSLPALCSLVHIISSHIPFYPQNNAWQHFRYIFYPERRSHNIHRAAGSGIRPNNSSVEGISTNKDCCSLD